jgi:mRNA interferase RelE/StbE
MYKIEMTKLARKSYYELPEKVRQSIRVKLERLSESPFASNNNVKRLQGMDHCYRLRIGDFRVLYGVYDDILVIEIIKIAHRKEVYK